jgi:thioredoxin-related protein
MLFGETIVVYRENHKEHTDTVRTSQETHYISATETNPLILFGVTVAVYCENHMEHTDIIRTLQETHHISTTETNRLMLFGVTVAVYCENHMEHTDTVRLQCPGVYLGHPVPGGYKHGVLALEVGGVECETVK